MLTGIPYLEPSTRRWWQATVLKESDLTWLKTSQRQNHKRVC
jgi:cytochrome b subunit of formate dehydrogenase